ncbi:MAG: hypothetical protein ACXVEB_14935, partial [Bacteroidia bacterium]
GNAYLYALMKDSTQFKNPLDVKIKCDVSGITYNLTPANYIIKDPGLFFYDTTGTGTNQTNVIYKMVTDGAPGHPHLNTNSIYELTATNGETGTVVTSKTLIVPDIGSFLAPNPAGSTFSFVIAGFYPNYKFKVEWMSAPNARQYQVILRLHYTDSTTSGNVAKYLDYQMPALTTDGLSGGEDLSVELYGRDFYKYIGTTLSDYSGLILRKTGNVDVLLVSGADDLVTFIDVNKPSTGIIQERPEFTNIVNGLGLFSSRLNKAPFSRPLSGSSLDSLSGGQYTCKLKFTDPSGVWTGCH